MVLKIDQNELQKLLLDFIMSLARNQTAGIKK